MSLEELKIERKRLKNLISDYDSWGPAQSINTDKYYDVLKLIREYEKKQFCGKCKTEQTMTKRTIGKEFCWWCPNCKDQIADSACYTSSGKRVKK